MFHKNYRGIVLPGCKVPEAEGIVFAQRIAAYDKSFCWSTAGAFERSRTAEGTQRGCPIACATAAKWNARIAENFSCTQVQCNAKRLMISQYKAAARAPACCSRIWA